MPCRVGLRAQHLVEPVGLKRADQPASGQARGVQDGGQRVFSGDALKQAGECGAVGDVARGDRHLSTEGFEVAAQFIGAGGVRAAPAREQQVPDAVLGHQVTGRQCAESTGAASDQHGSRGVPGPRRVLLGQRRGEPGHAHRAVVDRDLGLAGREDGGQHSAPHLVVAAVHEHEAARVLRLGGTDQAPDGGLLGTYVLGEGGAVPGDHDQACVSRAAPGARRARRRPRRARRRPRDRPVPRARLRRWPAEGEGPARSRRAAGRHARPPSRGRTR